MKKKINPNLTTEQKLVLFEDGTEPPNTSELNNEKSGSNSRIDFGARNCGALECSGSSMSNGPASSHLPNVRARSSSIPCGEDSGSNGSLAPQKEHKLA
jgi:hypothetical protein